MKNTKLVLVLIILLAIVLIVFYYLQKQVIQIMYKDNSVNSITSIYSSPDNSFSFTYPASLNLKVNNVYPLIISIGENYIFELNDTSITDCVGLCNIHKNLERPALIGNEYFSKIEQQHLNWSDKGDSYDLIRYEATKNKLVYSLTLIGSVADEYGDKRIDENLLNNEFIEIVKSLQIREVSQTLDMLVSQNEPLLVSTAVGNSPFSLKYYEDDYYSAYVQAYTEHTGINMYNATNSDYIDILNAPHLADVLRLFIFPKKETWWNQKNYSFPIELNTLGLRESSIGTVENSFARDISKSINAKMFVIPTKEDDYFAITTHQSNEVYMLSEGGSEAKKICVANWDLFKKSVTTLDSGETYVKYLDCGESESEEYKLKSYNVKTGEIKRAIE